MLTTFKTDGLILNLKFIKIQFENLAISFNNHFISAKNCYKLVNFAPKKEKKKKGITILSTDEIWLALIKMLFKYIQK